MRLFLVRHGETDANRILGHGVSGPTHNEPIIFESGDNTDISLNVIGRGHAAEASQELPDTIDDILRFLTIESKGDCENHCRDKKDKPLDYSTARGTR